MVYLLQSNCYQLFFQSQMEGGKEDTQCVLETDVQRQLRRLEQKCEQEEIYNENGKMAFQDNFYQPNVVQLNNPNNNLITVPEGQQVIIVNHQPKVTPTSTEWQRQQRIGCCCLSVHHQLYCCNIFCMTGFCRCIQNSNITCYCHNCDLIFCCATNLCKVCCQNRGMCECVVECCRYMPICLLLQCLKEKGCLQCFCNLLDVCKTSATFPCFCQSICCFLKCLSG